MTRPRPQPGTVFWQPRPTSTYFTVEPVIDEEEADLVWEKHGTVKARGVSFNSDGTVITQRVVLDNFNPTSYILVEAPND